MNLPLKIIIFMLSNVLGCFAAAGLLVLVVTTGVIDLSAQTIKPDFSQSFIFRVMLAWVVCGLFSISSFFIRGYWRFIFLLAPCVVPILYGIALLAAI